MRPGDVRVGVAREWESDFRGGAGGWQGCNACTRHPLKTQIQRRLKGQRQIEDTKYNPKGFYHVSSAGFLANYQQEGKRCVVPGDAFDGMEFG